jgi:hypothetical protein
VRSRDRLALVIADLFIYRLLSSGAAAKFNACKLQRQLVMDVQHMLSISLLRVGNPSSVTRDNEGTISNSTRTSDLIDQPICSQDDHS